MFEVDRISVAFGGVQAASEVSLHVAAGEIVGVIGPNGSGKTTVLNALTGLVRATGGASVEGRALPLPHPGPIRALGVLRLFQAPQTIDDLTTLENVMLSTPNRRLTGFLAAALRRRQVLAEERRRTELALDALATVGMDALADAEGGQLTYGQRRLVELARAIAGEPRVLMLDEPSAGLNETESRRLAQVLTGLRDRGLRLLVVDHKVDFLNAMCDRLVAMQQGLLIAEGVPSAVWRDERVVEAYLGAAHA